ncbi:hypothetical protein KLP28_09480 [Nocardioidaceae bacterium]|nr:hypothetical protein KLP28_09480 [Nocardioidaceae bacterium]
MPDLEKPETYNEKLQWLKLNYRPPGRATWVDKYAVKEKVARIVGQEHVIPTLAVFASAADIDFQMLPSSFVLKCTHDSGGVIAVREKNEADVKAIRRRMAAALRQDFYRVAREPEYMDVEPRIIAEPFLEDSRQGQLRDYKFFCFDGEVKAMFVASDRLSGDTKFDYFDRDFNSLDIRQAYPRSQTAPPKPLAFDQMLMISEKLSAGHPHIRVDLYEIDGRVYFGELTFYHFAGFVPFCPPETDKEWGTWLDLPNAVNPARKGRVGRR